MLAKWFAKSQLETEAGVKSTNLTIDCDQAAENLIFRHYAKLMRNNDPQPSDHLCADHLTLRELARNSFMKLYLRHVQICQQPNQTSADHETYRFVNEISDLTRRFIFYFNELKTLF